MKSKTDLSLISIIVPVFNVERYIHVCINSVLQQPFKDFGLILVEDGSPDRCPEICDEYVACDSRVKVIHKKMADLAMREIKGSSLRLVNISCLWIVTITFKTIASHLFPKV